MAVYTDVGENGIKLVKGLLCLLRTEFDVLTIKH